MALNHGLIAGAGISDYYLVMPPYYEYFMAGWMVFLGMLVGVFLPKYLAQFQDGNPARGEFLFKLAGWGIIGLFFGLFGSALVSQVPATIYWILMPSSSDYINPESIAATQAIMQSMMVSKSTILLWTNGLFLTVFAICWKISRSKKLKETFLLFLVAIMGLSVWTIVRTIELDGNFTDALLLCGLALLLPLASIGVTSQLMRLLSPDTATPDQ
jgi:hypothetical protein